MAPNKVLSWEEVFNTHPIFAELRKNSSSYAEGGLDASSAKYLLLMKDNHCFVWNEKHKSVDTFNLLNVQLKNEKEKTYQRLKCTPKPTYPVQSLLCNGDRLLAVIGKKGVTVLDLPRVWGKYGEFDGGKPEIICRCVSVCERLLVTSINTRVLQAQWHPASPSNTHLALLTSDNYIRVYSMSDTEVPVQVYPLYDINALPATLGTTALTASHRYSVAETAVAFDFGPPSVASTGVTACHTFVLFGNGDIYWVNTHCNSDYLDDSVIHGPMLMHPAADDNYGVDACSIMCLANTDPMFIAIITSNATAYHMLLLDTNTATQRTQSERRQDPDADIDTRGGGSEEDELCVYVYESVELELTLSLPEVSIRDDSSLLSASPTSLTSPAATATGQLTIQEYDMAGDFSTAIQLHQDAVSTCRYHCSHAAGVHTVIMPWLQQLQDLNSGTAAGQREEEQSRVGGGSDVSVNQVMDIFTNPQSGTIVEHVLCTKPLPSRGVSPLLGFSVTDNSTLGNAIVALTGEMSCVIKQLLPVSSQHYLPSQSSQTNTSSVGGGGVSKTWQEMSSLLLLPADSTNAHADKDRAGCRETVRERSQRLSGGSVGSAAVEPLSVTVQKLMSKAFTVPITALSHGADGGSKEGSVQEESLQLFSRSCQVLRQEYIGKQGAAMDVITDRVEMLHQMREEVMRDLDKFDVRRQKLVESAGKLSERYEEVKGRQDQLTNRLESVVSRLERHVPAGVGGLSEAERRMSTELASISDQLHSLHLALEEARRKKEYQEGRLATERRLQNEAATSSPGRRRLQPPQEAGEGGGGQRLAEPVQEQINEWLAQESAQIAELKERVSWLKVQSP